MQMPISGLWYQV